MDEQVVRVFTNELRTRMPLPKVWWANQIWEYQILMTGPTYVNATWPDFGLMSACVVLAGNCVFAGLKTDRVPGDKYEDKRKNVMRMTVDEVHRLIEDGGWMIRFRDAVSEDGASSVIIPSGFMMLFAGSDCSV